MEVWKFGVGRGWFLRRDAQLPIDRRSAPDFSRVRVQRAGIADDAAGRTAAHVPARVRAVVAMLRAAAASVQAGWRDVGHHVAAKVLRRGGSRRSCVGPGQPLG